MKYLQPTPSELRSETLSRQAYTAIRRAIRDRALVEGAYYSEFQIARLLGISRTPVREALVELSRTGMVVKIPQRGFRLRTISPEELREVFDLRELVETYVVRRLVSDCSAECLAKIDTILERQEAALNDPSGFLEVDEEFHVALAESVGLQRSRDTIQAFRGVIWVAGASSALIHDRRAPSVLMEHRGILEAVASRDVERACDAVRGHIAGTYDAVAGLLTVRPPASVNT